MMATTTTLSSQLTQARNELNNLRKKMQAMRAQHRKDIIKVEEMLKINLNQTNTSEVSATSCETLPGIQCPSKCCSNWKPIGHLKTSFHCKNGTPRQGSVSSLSRGMLRVEKDIFNNPQHSLEGLQEYSHVWIFFVFDQNNEGSRGSQGKSKVAPPRLNGERIGVFATRSPHRPNPLGLTLAQLEKVEGDCVYLCGLDILDGTPVIDIKPYIPAYDSPYSQSICSENLTSEDKTKVGSLHTVSSLDMNSSSNNEINIFESASENEISDQRTVDCCLTENSLLHEQISTSSAIPQEKLQCHVSLKQSVLHEPSGSTHSCRTTSADSMLCNVSESHTFEKESKSTISSGLDSESCESSGLPQNKLPSYEVKTAAWLKTLPIPTLEVIFNPIAENQILNFSATALDKPYR